MATPGTPYEDQRWLKSIERALVELKQPPQFLPDWKNVKGEDPIQHEGDARESSE
jgi:hypothetical protein